MVLVDLVVVSGFPHLCLTLLPLLPFHNLYVPNERLCKTLQLLTTITTSRFATIASTVPLMEGSLLVDRSPPRSEVSKRPHSSQLSQRHNKRSGGSRPVASSSRASASFSQVFAETGAQPCFPAPPISVSPSPPLPERSESSAVATPSLHSIPKDIIRSTSPLLAVPCSQGTPSVFLWFLGATSSHYAFSSVVRYVGALPSRW